MNNLGHLNYADGCIIRQLSKCMKGTRQRESSNENYELVIMNQCRLINCNRGIKVVKEVSNRETACVREYMTTLISIDNSLIPKLPLK